MVYMDQWYKIWMKYMNIMISKRNYYEFIYMKFKNRQSYGIRIMLPGRKEQVGGGLSRGIFSFSFFERGIFSLWKLISCTVIINAFFFSNFTTINIFLKIKMPVDGDKPHSAESK